MLTRSADRAAPRLLVRAAAEEDTSVDERAERLRGVVRDHYVGVWRFLQRLGFEAHVADDVVQEVFLVVLRRIDDVLPGRERAFLFAAAIRLATKMAGKVARERPVEHVPVPAEPVERATTPETLLDEERARQLLTRLLSELEERQRMVFVLYEIEEMTVPEIAELLEVPVGTVTSRLRAAREDFRGRLARHRTRTEREGSQ